MKRFRRRSVATLVVAMLAGTLVVVANMPAHAAGTSFFSQTFRSSTLNGTGDVYKPTVPGFSNIACLTASDNASASPLPACSPSSPDADGSGALQLTGADFIKVGGVFASTTIPTANGLDVSFNTYQYGMTGSSPADGLSFSVAAVDPADPSPPTNIGTEGGSLGYAPMPSFSKNGLDHGYLGFGIDVFGNYSNDVWSGTGCSSPAYIASNAPVPSQVVVRGPGHDLAGYCALASTATNTGSPPVALSGGPSGTRSTSVVPVRVIINPSASPITQGGLSVGASSYLIAFTPIGGVQETLTGSLPDASGFAPSSWLDSNGIPKQLAFGWAASTGGENEVHEVADVTINSVTPAPALSATQTVNGSIKPTGSTDNVFTITPSVAAGADESRAVSMTETFPSGITPTAASGTGWSCSINSQTVTCTTTGTSFPAGAALPSVAVTTSFSSAVSTTIIQSATARVFSDDAVAVFATATLPAAPTASPATSTGKGYAVQTTSVPVPTGGMVVFTKSGGRSSTLNTLYGTYRVNPLTGVMTFTPKSSSLGTPPEIANYLVIDAYERTATSTYSPFVEKPDPPIVQKIINKQPMSSPISTKVTVPEDGTIKLIDKTIPQQPKETTTLAIPNVGTYNLDIPTTTISFDPAPNFGGVAPPVTYKVTDVYGQSTESTFAAVVAPPTVGGATSATPTGKGYWTIDPKGDVEPHGDAKDAGSLNGKQLAAPIVGISANGNGTGYWLAASDGGVFSFGDVGFAGSMGGTKLNKPVVAISATPTAGGYWLAASDGGVFSFGDALFHGNTLQLNLNQPIVGITPTVTGDGYWLVAADGGIFAFGDAQFHGNTLDLKLNAPVVGLAATPSGKGYWVAAADGGVFAFGDAVFYGSDGGKKNATKTVGIIATSSGLGYSLVKADRTVVNFGDATL